MPDPLLFNIFVLLCSIVLVFKSADFVVYGISRYAKRFNFSDYLVGFVVVAMAASMPEVISSLTGLLLGKEDVMFGTILGTNIVHLGLVLGIVAVIGKKMNVECKILEGRLLMLWALLILPFILILWDGRLGRVDGIVLIIAYLIFVVGLWKRERKFGKVRQNVKLKSLWKDAFVFNGSMLALLISGNLLVWSATNIAGIIGISAYFIALTVIAISGATPDFAVSVKSALSGHQDIGVGDLIGSVVLELLFFFGVVGLINPLNVNVGQVLNVMIFLVSALTLVLFLIHRRWMTRTHGIILLAAYALFIGLEVMKIVR